MTSNFVGRYFYWFITTYAKICGSFCPKVGGSKKILKSVSGHFKTKKKILVESKLEREEGKSECFGQIFFCGFPNDEPTFSLERDETSELKICHNERYEKFM